MTELHITASSQTVAADLPSAQLGKRFGRLDTISQLALLAVERLGLNLDSPTENPAAAGGGGGAGVPPATGAQASSPAAPVRDRIAICLATRAGCLSTDIAYWQGRDTPGGPSPTLFTYTLPSSAIGEIAIRHRITGPNLCLIGDEQLLLAEARALIESGEADACVCVACESVTPEAATMAGVEPCSSAQAFLLQRTGM
jgi:hypothetical protein